MRIRPLSLALGAACVVILAACGSQVVGTAQPAGPGNAVPTDISFPTDATFPTDLSLPTDITFPTDVTLPTDVTFPTDIEFPTDVTFPTDIEFPTDITFPTDIEFPTDITFPTDIEFPTDITFPTDIVLPTGEISAACDPVSELLASMDGSAYTADPEKLAAEVAAAPEIADELTLITESLSGIDINDETAYLSLLGNPDFFPAFNTLLTWATTNCGGM